MLAMWLGWAGSSWATGDGLQPVPTLSGHVIDQSNTLSAAQKQALDTRLASLQQQRGSQVVVLLVASTQPEDIASYAQRVGDTWKIGRKEVGDGLLIVVAKEDHSVRIEVAKALEGAIPDLAAKRIIDQDLTPAFKAGDVAGGLTRAIDDIDRLIAGEKLPEPTADASSASGSDVSVDDVLGLLGMAASVAFLALAMVAKLLAKLLGDTLGVVATHLLVGGLAWFFSGSWVIGLSAVVVVAAIFLWGILGVSFGSGGSSSGRGGFSSGGGGDFGGGGASGKW